MKAEPPMRRFNNQFYGYCKTLKALRPESASPTYIKRRSVRGQSIMSTIISSRRCRAGF